MSLRCAFVLSLALLAPAPACAQAASEAAIKAAYLVKFAAYVGWPIRSGPVTICQVGRDVLGGALEQAATGQQVDGRPIQVRRLDSIARGSGCDIAYLAGSGRQPVPAALAALASSPVLTITDDRWSKARGMIHFQVAANRVRFHVNDQAAADGGLNISSKLLGLALSVRPRQGR
ncbi:YfiR family protein [Sphingomonas sp. ID1715]|uniref:YfiR family protein n=1 Tax=Sphingomonas sp. ID1715 TaxID=1656898 RepID=UPI001C2C0B8F|nr:YfiR family protein [Sphingomonas sp. ID1715]